MLFFGHIGITLGVGIAAIAAYRKLKARQPRLSAKSLPLDLARPERAAAGFEGPRMSPPFLSLNAQLRLLICCVIGSLLPDIIDKPIGNFVFANTFHGNGRIFAHTLLFASIVLAIGLILYFTKRSKMGLVLAYGVFMHLILDSMWRTPQTLFWPFQGWSFPMGETTLWTSWIQNMLEGAKSPSVWVPEALGLAVAVGIGFVYLREIKRQNIKGKRQN